MTFKTSLKSSLKAFCAIAALVAAPFSQAAYVTIDELRLDEVFSQDSFGTRKIDIRIGGVTQIIRPDLLDINTAPKLTSLFGLHTGASNVVNFYFVDTLSSCGNINVNYIGCGQVGGPNFVVESDWAARTDIPSGAVMPYGAQLLAHELGHNLGLGHRNGANLMDPFINGMMDLNASEVEVILGSSLVQMDGQGQRFIQINPVLILAAANSVPEPSTLALVLVGLLFAGARQRKLRLMQ